MEDTRRNGMIPHRIRYFQSLFQCREPNCNTAWSINQFHGAATRSPCINCLAITDTFQVVSSTDCSACSECLLINIILSLSYSRLWAFRQQLITDWRLILVFYEVLYSRWRMMPSKLSAHCRSSSSMEWMNFFCEKRLFWASGNKWNIMILCAVFQILFEYSSAVFFCCGLWLFHCVDCIVYIERSAQNVGFQLNQYLSYESK